MAIDPKKQSRLGAYPPKDNPAATFGRVATRRLITARLT
jgi:hypothetical protein